MYLKKIHCLILSFTLSRQKGRLYTYQSTRIFAFIKLFCYSKIGNVTKDLVVWPFNFGLCVPTRLSFWIQSSYLMRKSNLTLTPNFESVLIFYNHHSNICSYLNPDNNQGWGRRMRKSIYRNTLSFSLPLEHYPGVEQQSVPLNHFQRVEVFIIYTETVN